MAYIVITIALGYLYAKMDDGETHRASNYPSSSAPTAVSSPSYPVAPAPSLCVLFEQSRPLVCKVHPPLGRRPCPATLGHSSWDGEVGEVFQRRRVGFACYRADRVTPQCVEFGWRQHHLADACQDRTRGIGGCQLQAALLASF